jgi:hypothetical protein
MRQVSCYVTRSSTIQTGVPAHHGSEQFQSSVFKLSLVRWASPSPLPTPGQSSQPMVKRKPRLIVNSRSVKHARVASLLGLFTWTSTGGRPSPRLLATCPQTVRCCLKGFLITSLLRDRCRSLSLNAILICLRITLALSIVSV